jgi:hypothetical protein
MLTCIKILGRAPDAGGEMHVNWQVGKAANQVAKERIWTPTVSCDFDGCPQQCSL